MTTSMQQPPPVAPFKHAFDRVALVLQGGGALGSYQAGVFEGLATHGIEPDWIAGISIGAINCALIAGNAPERRVERLREFWETVCQPAYFAGSAEWLQASAARAGGLARTLFNAFEAGRTVVEGQRGFFTPRLVPPWLPESDLRRLSWYDISPLKQTLERLVDFDRINEGPMRVTVSAVNVATGNLECFDNREGRWQGRLAAEHFMASGALPPGFPAVQIEGDYYWDGGLVSNTPLAEVVAGTTNENTLVFQVDLWSARGPLPANLFDVEERQKDIRYSSRTRAVTNMLAREHKLRMLLREALDLVPASERDKPWYAAADCHAQDRRINILHLIYQEKEWDGVNKDYEFGPLTMREHWASGLEDLCHTLAQEHWLRLPSRHEAVLAHDVHQLRAAAGTVAGDAPGAQVESKARAASGLATKR